MLKRRTKDVTVAQLDRVSGYEPEGRGFESLQSRQRKPPQAGGFYFMELPSVSAEQRGWPRGLGTAAPCESLQSRHENPHKLGVFTLWGDPRYRQSLAGVASRTSSRSGRCLAERLRDRVFKVESAYPSRLTRYRPPQGRLPVAGQIHLILDRDPNWSQIPAARRPDPPHPGS